MNAHVENQNHGSTGVRNARIRFYHKGTGVAPRLNPALRPGKLGLGSLLSLGRMATPAADGRESRPNYAAVCVCFPPVRHCKSIAEPITQQIDTAH
jgi:hypothetical protein